MGEGVREWKRHFRSRKRQVQKCAFLKGSCIVFGKWLQFGWSLQYNGRGELREVDKGPVIDWLWIWPTLFPFLAHALQWDFAASSIKRQSLFLSPWKLGWPSDSAGQWNVAEVVMYSSGSATELAVHFPLAALEPAQVPWEQAQLTFWRRRIMWPSLPYCSRW